MGVLGWGRPLARYEMRRGRGGGGLLSVSGPIQEARGYDHVAVTRSCWESGSGDETRVHACGLVLYPDRL